VGFVGLPDLVVEVVVLGIREQQLVDDRDLDPLTGDGAQDERAVAVHDPGRAEKAVRRLVPGRVLPPEDDLVGPAIDLLDGVVDVRQTTGLGVFQPPRVGQVLSLILVLPPAGHHDVLPNRPVLRARQERVVLLDGDPLPAWQMARHRRLPGIGRPFHHERQPRETGR
jgi:hypothetical protein